jgi:hypothetical protein
LFSITYKIVSVNPTSSSTPLKPDAIDLCPDFFATFIRVTQAQPSWLMSTNPIAHAAADEEIVFINPSLGQRGIHSCHEVVVVPTRVLFR